MSYKSKKKKKEFGDKIYKGNSIAKILHALHALKKSKGLSALQINILF